MGNRGWMLGLVLALGLVLVRPVQAQESPPEAQRPPEIAVTGTGTVRLSPDYATVRFSVVTRESQAARAGEANARLMSAVRAALKARLSVPDDSLPTVWYAVSPDYDRGRQVGYQAQSVLQARVWDLARVGPVIDAALEAGATGVQDVEFGSSRREEAHLQALAQAVRSARRQAEAMAVAAGGALGALLSVTTFAAAPAAPMSMMRAAAVTEAATPIAPPALEVTATVSARWRFVPR
jgi:uncharacterized protein YggE